MNLRDLEYFVKVAELKHFGQAAKECHVSQPTLSGQIKKLEEEMGVILFERSNRRVMLTEAGATILPYAKQTLTSADSVLEVAETLNSPFAGRFHLAAIPTMGSYLFPLIVSGIKKSMPDLTLILSEEKTFDLLEKLKEGKLDAGILALPVNDDSLKEATLFTDEFFLATPKEHPLTTSDAINVEQLNNRQLLLLEEGHCLRGQALQA